jgi:integrase
LEKVGNVKRHSTKYPGVFYRETERIGGPGKERVFYIIFKRNGKVIEEKVGRQYSDNMTEAKASRIRAERIENKRPSRKELREEQKAVQWTLNALWDAYCEANPANKGLVHEKNKWKRNIKDGLGKKQPSELSPLDTDRLRLGLQRSGKETTAARVLELIRRTVNFGTKRNLVETLKFKITLPRLNNQTTEDLTPEELSRLVKALDNDYDKTAANLMRLALYTGMRRGEMLGLAWDAVDFERGFITIRDPKGGRDQTIPMNAAARAVLESHPRDSESPWVFPGRREGKHATEMRKSINRICKAAGLPEGFRPLHGLRHVYASTLASSGEVDLYTLQRLLTHKSPAMTQRYAHLRDDALRRAGAVIDRLFHNPQGNQPGESSERQKNESPHKTKAG